MENNLNQKSDSRNQNEKEKFKKDFNQRLIRLSIDFIKFSIEIKSIGALSIILNQLVRSITSVGANIIEAKASSSKREYIKFFEIALKSANESLYWLLILKEIKIDKLLEINQFYQRILEISKIIAASILTLKGKKQF